jgi:hypothetical protein
MKRYFVSAAVVVLTIALVVLANGIRNFRGILTGYEEVPAVSTTASGDFRATINDTETEITYELSYSDLEGSVQQAHIHFGQAGVNGSVEVWLCSNLASPPTPPSPPNPATQTCPAPPATITGVITPAHVIGQSGASAGQGIQPGEFDELVRAIRAGKTYANVHTTKFPTGEVRSQLGPGNSKGDHGGH